MKIVYLLLTLLSLQLFVTAQHKPQKTSLQTKLIGKWFGYKNNYGEFEEAKKKMESKKSTDAFIDYVFYTNGKFKSFDKVKRPKSIYNDSSYYKVTADSTILVGKLKFKIISITNKKLVIYELPDLSRTLKGNLRVFTRKEENPIKKGTHSVDFYIP
ncbi:hypothetical protein HDF26_003053 [Pedobacter cryoconitis]|uniref:hypothetical protein n=1 Tax=Pedobacter cryoconitis TaxID=188932 RepID=UPI00160F292A|nr:hypothetical protein [Pedobacter cryoconitis]MBB6272596.1 hypothetical protein [Pedobacter cryoconitis]